MSVEKGCNETDIHHPIQARPLAVLADPVPIYS